MDEAIDRFEAYLSDALPPGILRTDKVRLKEALRYFARAVKDEALEEMKQYIRDFAFVTEDGGVGI